MDEETIEFRLGKVEQEMCEVRRDVKNILVNHLPHITNDLASIKARLTIVITVMLATLGALIAFFINLK